MVYEPTEGRVSTRVNGLLYSLPVMTLGNSGLPSARAQT